MFICSHAHSCGASSNQHCHIIYSFVYWTAELGAHEKRLELNISAASSCYWDENWKLKK